MKYKNILLTIYDVFAIFLCWYGSLFLRFDSFIPIRFFTLTSINAFIIVMTTLIVFHFFKLYSSLLRYASIPELKNVVLACFVSTFCNSAILGFSHLSMPRSWYIIYFFLLVIFTCVSRIGYRLLLSMTGERSLFTTHKLKRKNILIIGAGQAGSKIAKEISEVSLIHKKVVCFIDDMESKNKMYIQGKLVYGNRSKIYEAVKRFDVDEIIIAMPSVSTKVRKEIVELCKDTHCKVKTLPELFQLHDVDVSVNVLRNVEIEDLLGRDTICVNVNEIHDYIQDKVVMVTGGGGSIGSELCRQIAQKKPSKLVIVDIYENNAYDIQMELLETFKDLDLDVMIASVRDEKKINSLFNTYKPHVVYHAAAHKHVPLMEDAPNEAVKNNVFGTLNVVKAAHDNGVERFVLISSDKAVNPTNIMGATKRICEMIIQTYNKTSNTEFVAVRFGNVLGSNGSVIPLFKKQIEKGGPITITHPEITRYFMTIPEAVSLVLQAGAYASGGEIFVLDMGEPVKIKDLAYNLITFSGLTPNVDIMVEYTGLRPGEKLFEELLMDEEGMQTTKNALIKIGKPIDLDENNLFEHLDKLLSAALNETSDMKSLVHQLVNTYKIDQN